MPPKKRVEKVEFRSTLEGQTSGRMLSGFGLWSARIAYVVLLFFLVALFLIGTPKYLEAIQQSGIGITVTRENTNSFIISDAIPQLYQAGIQTGDILQAVNGHNLGSDATLDNIQNLLIGPIGQSVTLSVQTENGSRFDVSIIRGDDLLQSLQRLGLTLHTLVLFYIILSSALMFGFALISFLIFIRRSNDWFVILVALTQILLPLTLLIVPPLSYGAKALNINNLVEIIRMFSLLPLVAMIYIFPKGELNPKWLSVFLLIAGILVSVNIANFIFGWFSDFLNTLLGNWSWWALFLVGVMAQIYRYRKTYSRLERQQTKWVLIGIVLSAAVYFISQELQFPNASILWLILIGMARYLSVGAALFFFAISLAFAVFRYKLWDTDFYINRTIIYGLVTAILALLWGATVALLNYVFQQFTDKQSPLLAAVLSSIQIVAVFQPVRDGVEKWVNSRFYKDRIDFTSAIIELQPERWQFITPQDLYEAVAESVANLLKSDKAVVYLMSGVLAQAVASNDGKPSKAHSLKLDDKVFQRLREGAAVRLPASDSFAVLVPLVLPLGPINNLIGVLALGARADERGYSRDHLSDLMDLGTTAGTAIHFLLLNQKKLANSA